MRGRISVGRDISRQLREEFGVSRTGLSNALNYRFDTPLNSKIQARAKELLEAHVKEVNELFEK